MPTINERLANFFNPGQQAQIDEQQEQLGALSEAFNLLAQAQAEGWDEQPLSPDQLATKIQEAGYDSGFVYDLLQQKEWETLGGGAYVNSGARMRIADDSRRLWIYSPLYQWAVKLWTNYVFSQAANIVPLDETAVDTWAAFWTADKNDPVLASDKMQGASNDVLVDGNLYWAYHASDQDGETIITEIPWKEIKEVLYHPRITSLPVFYKRVFRMADKDITWYYPNWQARSIGILDEVFGNPGDPSLTVAQWHKIKPEQRTDLMSIDSKAIGAKEFAGTVTVMQAIHWNVKAKDDPFGWALSCASGPYLRAHHGFMEGRFTVTKAVAMFVRKMSVQGGSRAVKSTITDVASTVSRLTYRDGNPPPAAGSTLVHNKAVDSSEMPLITGAQDATADNDMFAWIEALGVGLFKHYVGIDSYRLATAKTMERPLEMQWSGYREFWKAQLRRMVRIVLEFSNEFGGTAYETKSQITLDSLTTIDIEAASNGIGRMFTQVFTPALNSNSIDEDTYESLVNFTVDYTLQALGGNDLAQQIQLDLAQKADEPDDEDSEPDTDAEPEEPQEERDQSQALALVYGLENMLNGTITEEQFEGHFREVIGEQGNEQ